MIQLARKFDFEAIFIFIEQNLGNVMAENIIYWTTKQLKWNR